MRQRRIHVCRKRVNLGLPSIGTGVQANAGRGRDLVNDGLDFGSQRPNRARQRRVQSSVGIAHFLTSRLSAGDIACSDSASRTSHSTLDVLARVGSFCRPSQHRARFLRRPHLALPRNLRRHIREELWHRAWPGMPRCRVRRRGGGGGYVGHLRAPREDYGACYRRREPSNYGSHARPLPAAPCAVTPVSAQATHGPPYSSPPKQTPRINCRAPVRPE
jgi:hypothetical protein